MPCCRYSLAVHELFERKMTQVGVCALSRWQQVGVGDKCPLSIQRCRVVPKQSGQLALVLEQIKHNLPSTLSRQKLPSSVAKGRGSRGVEAEGLEI